MMTLCACLDVVAQEHAPPLVLHVHSTGSSYTIISVFIRDLQIRDHNIIVASTEGRRGSHFITFYKRQQHQ
jgi:hypothetical protein